MINKAMRVNMDGSLYRMAKDSSRRGFWRGIRQGIIAGAITLAWLMGVYIVYLLARLIQELT